ncbi:MAG: TRAP-type transport system periplasmic protein [Thermoanaerobacteraceae bacterium]|nr:TRAP-type transport system periplasmic protein [Thermoanaerobacteraceae bacterium]
MRKKLLSLLALLLTLTLILTACSGKTGNQGQSAAGDKTGDKTYKIKVAAYFAYDHPQIVAMREKFKKIVEEESGGKITVEIYENNKLGSEEQFIDGVRNGTIEMAISGLLISKDYPIIGMLEMPYLFRDYDHAYKALEEPGEIGKEMVKDMPDKLGVRVLDFTANGFRVISSNRVIKKFEELKGLKLRIPNAPRFIKFAEAIGANPVPMPLSEVFTALEQKAIDGQENPYATLRASSFYEVQKGVLDSRHMFSPNIYIINEKFWQSLGPDLQKVVEKAAKESAKYEWQLLKESESADIDFLKQKGLEVVYPDEEFKNKLIESQKPVQQWFFDTLPGSKEIYEKIQAVQ